MAVSVTINGSVAVVTIDNPPVNAASHVLRQGLVDAISQTEADNGVKAVVLICAGRTFVAGADVREFGRPAEAPLLRNVVNALEKTTKPWVAAIHGTALGGGLEIALGCHYRIATKTAKLGLPEVSLGLIPGAGGTVRLPRLIGATAALDMIASGKPVGAGAALDSGLINVVTGGDLCEVAVQFARDRAGESVPATLTQTEIPDFDAAALQQAMNKVRAKACGQNSPVAVCEAVQNTVSLSATQALQTERDIFLRLKDDPQSLALRHIFFEERAAGKIDAIDGVQAPALQEIGVIGGGTMGAGIAAACLLAGLSVTMIEQDADTLALGQSRTFDILSGSLKRGLISENAHNAMINAFNGDTDYVGLSNADLVIEAVFEDMAVKHEVFQAIAAVTRHDTILASNTSYLDIGDIAQAVPHPARVIGLHFFSPAHIMKLLELVIPDGASPQAIAAGVVLGKRLHKITVPSRVCDGFIGNRIMSAYRRACEYMIEDGAMPVQIDAAMRSFGFPMGIFEMQDLAGLDISWAMRKRKAATRDPAERYVDIADKLCEMGRLGRKTGRGWYLYNGSVATPDPEVDALITSEAARKGITRRPFTADEIVAEILTTMQVEGAAILAEGIAAKASDIDVVMVNGFGFPRWRGGPMYLKE